MNFRVNEKYYKYCPNCKTNLQRKIIENATRLYCPSCDFIFWDNPKPVVSILLHTDEKILMLQRAKNPLKNYWCLPGGFVNSSEAPEQAVKREIKEELDMDIDIDEILGAYLIDNDPRGIHIDIIYIGKPKGSIHLSNEHSKYAYFQKSELPDLIAYKHREAISDWIKNNDE